MADSNYNPKSSGIMSSGLLRRFGTRSTQLVAKICGEFFPFYYVSEYPRSGGTWLGEMLAAYLKLPLPQQAVAPTFRSSVIHNHWGFSKRLKRVFYLHRDGRDVCTSMYFFCLRALAHDNAAMRKYYRAKLPQAVEQNWRPEESRQHMSKFIRIWATRPMGCRITWSDHVQQWAFDRPNVVRVSYEELRNDCVAALQRIIPQHVPGELNSARIEEVVEKFSFAQMTGRNPGEQDSTSFLRKGVVGDWKNHFDRSAAEVFDRYAGDLLIRLGYEADRSWASRIEPDGAKTSTAEVTK